MDTPHHEVASTRSNLSVEDTFDGTHAKEISGADHCAVDLHFTILDSPEKEREDFRAKTRRTLRDNAAFHDFGLTGEGTGGLPREDQAHTKRQRRQVTTTARSIIRGRLINIIWHPRSIAIWGRWAIIARAQHRYQPSAAEGPHARTNGRTPVGKAPKRILESTPED